MEAETGTASAATPASPMTTRVGVRVLHLIMALYLVASAIEMLDRSGLADDHPVVGETAQTLRDVRAGDDPFGIGEDVERAVETVRRLVDAFNQAGEAIN